MTHAKRLRVNREKTRIPKEVRVSRTIQRILLEESKVSESNTLKLEWLKNE